MFSPIVFAIKNEKKKSSIAINDTPVTIGECVIPLNLLYNSEFKRHGCLEVNLTLKLRNCQNVGTIKAVLAFSNKKLEGLTEAVQLCTNEHKEYENLMVFEAIVRINLLYKLVNKS